jgi:hypothetical protein
MSRRNVVIESSRQRRQRMLRLERAEVLGALYDELEDNSARRNEMTTQMHALQQGIEELKIDAGRIAERIDEENSYYHRGELELTVQWPRDCQMDPMPEPTLRFELRGPRPEPSTDWNSATPVVSCFVGRHPRGTPAHLITECDVFRRFTVTDRAHLIRHLDLCWACWVPRYYTNGRLHNADDCPHPRLCRRCNSTRHNEALCGAPMVTRAAWLKTR